MTDVTPSEYIFKELQAVHATGLLTDQLSLEDEWQQTFFEMDQVLSSSPNPRINTNYSNTNTSATNNNNGNSGDHNNNVADNIQVSAMHLALGQQQTNQLACVSNGLATDARQQSDNRPPPTVVNCTNSTTETTTTISNNRYHNFPLLVNDDEQQPTNMSEMPMSTIAANQSNDNNYLHHHLLLQQQQQQQLQLQHQIQQQLLLHQHQQQTPSPNSYFCPTIVAPCDVQCAPSTMITVNSIPGAVLSNQQLQQPPQPQQLQQQPLLQQPSQPQQKLQKVNQKQRSGSLNNNSAITNHNAKSRDRPTRLDCPFCERTFCKNFDLQQHMRCHTGEKPFQCIVCGRGFAQKSNVKKHMQAHKVWPDGSTISNNSNGASNGNTARANNKDDGHEARSRSNSASCPSVIQSCRANSATDSTKGTNNPYSLDEASNNEGDRIGAMSENTDSSLGGGLIPFGFCNHKSDLSNEDITTPSVDNRYACSYCKFNGRTYFELKSHLTVHKREKVFKCIVSSCGKTFAGNDLQSFLEHVTSHKNELVYRCHLCSSQFNSLSELGYHQHEHNLLTQTNTQQKQQLQQQHLSQEQQSSPYSNNSEIQEHNPPQQQPKQQLYLKQTRSCTQNYFRCSKCMNRYTTLTALEHHISISTHHYPCTECEKVFPCERYLRRHLNTHTSILHVCTYCDKQFKTAAYLKMHKIVHTGEKPFQCNLCDAAFNRRDKLNRHKLTHEPYKKYKCPFKHHTGCPKEFNRPDKLKAHILTHSGIRPHQCDICERSFSRQTHLREHKKLLHESTFNISQYL